MEIVVDDQAFVVGLAELFRQEMKAFEVATLLPLAETACKTLGLSPAMVPIEGYYSESAELEKFFRLMRALQLAEMREVSPGSGRDAIYRLREIFASPVMGRVEESDKVVPRTTSPLGEALRILASWSIDSLARQAQQLIKDDDVGLVAVAAATGDPVALCVARESVALAADVELAEVEMELPQFDWAVSEHVTRVAGRFISALTKATGIILPEPQAANSNIYGQVARDAELSGRCILIGERSGNPYPYYHWYIDQHDDQCAVKDFWSSDIWTTDSLRYMPISRRPAAGIKIGAPETAYEQSGKGKKGWFQRLFQRT